MGVHGGDRYVTHTWALRDCVWTAGRTLVPCLGSRDSSLPRTFVLCLGSREPLTGDVRPGSRGMGVSSGSRGRLTGDVRPDSRGPVTGDIGPGSRELGPFVLVAENWRPFTE